MPAAKKKKSTSATKKVDANTKRRVKVVIDRYAKTEPHSRAVSLSSKFRHKQRVKHKCKFRDREGIQRCPLKRHVQASARHRTPIPSGSAKPKTPKPTTQPKQPKTKTNAATKAKSKTKANVPKTAPTRKRAPHEGYTYGFWKQGIRSKYYKKILNSAKYVKSICKKGISYGYARGLARSGGFGFLVYAKKVSDRAPRHLVWDTNANGERMGVPVGFAVLRSRQESVYIELVCSNKPGLGKNMMREIDTLAYHTYNKREVTLSAVPGAIGFYKKIGFKPTITDEQYAKMKENDPDDDLLPMARQLIAGKTRKKKT